MTRVVGRAQRIAVGVLIAATATACVDRHDGSDIAPPVMGVDRQLAPTSTPSSAPTPTRIPTTLARSIVSSRSALGPRSTAGPRGTVVGAASTPVSHSALDAAALVERTDLQVSASLWVDGHGIVWAHHPDLALYPASNQKLLTAAGALELLPMDHRFRTAVYRTGDDGATDLYLVAGGDPTLTSGRLRDLALETARRLDTTGVENVYVDDSRFERSTTADGWQDWHIPTYVGPMSALTVDDNRWSTAEAFLADPALVNAGLFTEPIGLLALQPTRAPLPTEAVLVAEVESAPLADLLTAMLASSDNQTADAIVREIDAVAGGPGGTARGLERIADALNLVGVPVGGVDGDGSGLSRANRRSSADWVALLVGVRGRPWFEQYVERLPVASRSGTLAGRLGGPSTAGNVTAKTGTIIGGRSLSGYLTIGSGQPAVFSIVVNGEASHSALADIDALVEEFAALELPSVTPTTVPDLE